MYCAVNDSVFNQSDNVHLAADEEEPQLIR